MAKKSCDGQCNQAEKKRTELRPWLNTIILIPTLIECHKPHADDVKVSTGRDHVAKSVTAGLYLFEWEVLSAFPGIFLCML